jgi:hypothetical protein
MCRDLLVDMSRVWGVFWIDISTTDLAERSFLLVVNIVLHAIMNAAFV